MSIQLVEIESGGLRNAIPREGKAIFGVENATTFIAHIQPLANEIIEEFASLEKDLTITIEKVEKQREWNISRGF